METLLFELPSIIIYLAVVKKGFLQTYLFLSTNWEKDIHDIPFVKPGLKPVSAIKPNILTHYINLIDIPWKTMVTLKLPWRIEVGTLWISPLSLRQAWNGTAVSRKVGEVIGEWEKPMGFNEAKLGFSKFFMADWCFFVHLELMFFMTSKK